MLIIHAGYRSKNATSSTGLRAGLAFMTLHFGDDVDPNRLTIEAVDPKSGTAEFKATAVRIERIPAPVGAPDAPPAR